MDLASIAILSHFPSELFYFPLEISENAGMKEQEANAIKFYRSGILASNIFCKWKNFTVHKGTV